MHVRFPKCVANSAGKLESRQPTSLLSSEPSQLTPELCAWGHVALRTARRSSGKQQATQTAPCRSLSMHSQSVGSCCLLHGKCQHFSNPREIRSKNTWTGRPLERAQRTLLGDGDFICEIISTSRGRNRVWASTVSSIHFHHRGRPVNVD